MITADQVLAHVVGDYILQSHWMATEKTKRSLAAAVHVVFYAVLFLIAFKPSWLALAVIVGSHFVIDRWRLARFVVWAKNLIAPIEFLRVNSRESAREYVAMVGGKHAFVWLGPVAVVAMWNQRWSECKATGYTPDVPAWLSVWLLIITDNAMHIACNALALRYL